MSKTELIKVLKGAANKKAEKKAHTLRIDSEIFEKIEEISESSGIKNINTVLVTLIEIGLAEYNKA